MIIFLAGAHGVGKSYLASRVLGRLGIPHFTASQLIREEKGHQSWSVDRRVQDADANQELLIAAVARAKQSSTHFVLDGHFVLRGADGELITLEPDVFRRLNVDAVILMEAPNDVVVQRLVARTGEAPDPQQVAALAIAERDHASYVSSKLEVPFVSLTSPTEEQFAGAVSALFTPGD